MSRRQQMTGKAERLLRTFMFTDVVGSTTIRHDYIRRFGTVEGNRLFRHTVLRPHDGRLERIIRQTGTTVSTAGDSYLVAFVSARDALPCAVAFVRSLVEEPIALTPWSKADARGLEVRVGLHTGPATRVVRAGRSNYDGETLNVAHRIQDCAQPNQILASKDSVMEAGRLAGVRVRRWPGYRLRGVTGTWTLQELLWRGHPPTRPRVRESAARRSRPRSATRVEPLLAAEAVTPGFQPPAAESAQAYFVGREDELQRFVDWTARSTASSVLNIYGPGGIGKTALCDALIRRCATAEMPWAHVAGDELQITADKVLYLWGHGLRRHGPIDAIQHFKEFDDVFADSVAVKEILAAAGGLDHLFSVAGHPASEPNVKDLASDIGYPWTRVARHFRHRDVLAQYLEGLDDRLTASFMTSLRHFVRSAGRPVVLFCDAFETMASLHGWMRASFVRRLASSGARLVVLGRDKLVNTHPDWRSKAGRDLEHHELSELGEADAKAYLRHHGLDEAAALDRIYEFTRGYPLCLALVVELAREITWAAVGDFSGPGFRDRVAGQLLESLLRQPAVRDVQPFLERGVVARWFDPEVIGCVLGISIDEARQVYEKVGRFSFVSPHPNGLKFHDTVRELLLARLWFTDRGATYTEVARRLSEYWHRKNEAMDLP